MKTKQFAVIGIGLFGESLVYALRKLNHQVLAIDINPDRIENIANIATHAVEADATDEKTLKALDIQSFETVIVAIGGNLESSILTVLTLQELGVKRIVVKAQNVMYGKVLEKMGIQTVIYPERDMAFRLARSLISSSIIEQIEISSDFGITEFRAPQAFFEHSLAELQLPNRFQVTILAIKSGDQIEVTPSADSIVHEGDLLVAFGKNNFIDDLSEMSNE